VPVQQSPWRSAIDPSGASVFDLPGQGLLRKVVGLLGLDDPNNLLAIGTPMETGASTGGLLDAVAQKFPRFANAIKAYHGSPHDFKPEPDAPLGRFKTSAIGTGEGAQAYGHGLYFAENPRVAEEYRTSLAGQPELKNLKLGALNVGQHNGFDYSPRGNSIYEKVRASLAEDLLIDQVGLTGVPPEKLQTHVLQRLDEKIADYTKEWPQAVDAAKQLRADLSKPRAVALTYGERPGKTYEVGINAHPDQFLDWDKPLSQQHPDVQAALRKIGVSPDPDAWQWKPHQITADDVARRTVPSASEGDWIVAQKDATGKIQATGGISHSSLRSAEENAYKRNQLNALAPNDKGEALYRDLQSKLGTREGASMALRDAGIPGIKYLDEGSRSLGQVQQMGDKGNWFIKGSMTPYPTAQAAHAALDASGQVSRNFVVFDEKTVDILRKYGVLPPLAGAALANQSQKE
jgi:hypothetical protein